MPRRAHAASFRDPSGFIFHREGTLYRQVNQSFADDWAKLTSTGFYEGLAQKGSVVPFQEVGRDLAITDEAIAVIHPERVDFISYPYEWSFSQLKDAAILTLDIAMEAIKSGFSLKDATAFNIQFHKGKPIFIDTLSFEAYVEGEPWIAYKQFCQHFLAPLALMSYVDVRLLGLFRTHLDGIPLDLTSHLLPGMTKLKPGLLSHIHLHAKAQGKEGSSGQSERTVKIPKTSLLALLDNLRSTVQSLSWEPSGTEWADYYTFTNYTDEAMQQKRSLVGKLLDEIKPDCKTACDLGANNGAFSSLCAERGLFTLAWDIDPAAVEKAYRSCRKAGQEKILPLVVDLSNPTPATGWNLEERSSFFDRAEVDVALALAVIHHLAISNNTPLPLIADLFSRLGRYVIVEWVPKEDSQVQKMMRARKDIFAGYTIEGFRQAASEFFETLREEPIPGTLRTLFLLKRR